jgi:hypothetical protein
VAAQLRRHQHNVEKSREALAPGERSREAG